MATNRRSFFKLLGIGAAASALPAATEAAIAAGEPLPFLGQIRVVHSHYETKPFAPNGYFSSATTYTQSVAVLRYEQWNGREWADIGAAPLAAPQPPSHTHPLSIEQMPSHTHTISR